MANDPAPTAYGLSRDVDLSPVWERLFAALPDVVFCMKDLEFRYISANQAFADRLGLPGPARVLGKTVEDVFPAHLAASYRQQDEQLVRTGRDLVDHLELITNRDRKLGWYVTTKVLLRHGDGSPAAIASISRDLLTPGSEALEFAGLARTIDFIHAHLEDPLRPATLAAEAGMSQAQLDRRMRRAFRLTTAQFIRKSRIEHAARLLTDTDEQIVDIALSSGYADQSSFTRQFHSAVGQPPAAYRALHRKSGK
jgi:PAS domain S-box-containing protein